jgi:D-alanine-D-alanine ligase
VCPANVPQKLADRIAKIAEAAWRAMQGKGYGRVDLRVDDQGRPWVLDVNPNPDLNDDAGLSRMARAAGWDYPDLVRRIAEVALREAQGAKAARELLAPARRSRAARTT